MTYQWTTNFNTPITEDGQLGPQTLRALQYGLGLTSVKGGGTGVFDTATITAFQTYLKVTADGQFGPISTRALQTLLGVTPDGSTWGTSSAVNSTTLALQKGLNLGNLAGAAGTSGGGGTGTGGGRSPIAESSVTYQRGQTVSLGQQGTIQAACNAAGLIYSTGWLNGYITIGNRESSWDPNAINNYDSNATGPIQADGFPQNCSRGLFQCIPPTFSTYHATGTSNDIYDPVANGAASMLYVVAVYGVSADGHDLAAKVQQADPNRPPAGY